MPEFTEDWSYDRSYWSDLLASMEGKTGLRFLEIGCFEGMATLWLLEHILTDPSSTVWVVDTFQGSAEHSDMGVRVAGMLDRFRRNLSEYEHQVQIWVGRSQDVLCQWELRDDFDFVYVDGSHAARDVLTDAVLAWPMLRAGGLMVFDDYEWDGAGLNLSEHQRPKVAIDAFLEVFAEELTVVHRAYQVAVAKVVDSEGR